MAIDELINQSNNLLKKHDIQRNLEYLKKIERLFETYLEENKTDTDVALKFAIFLFEKLHDDYKAMDILENVLEYDPNNIRAALIMAYLDFTLMFRHEEYSLSKLNELQTNDSELLSMIELIKALHYSKTGDYFRYESYLKKSIQYYDKHVKNNYFLGAFYLDLGKTNEGKKLVQKALNNIRLIFVYLGKSETTITTVDEFLDEHIRGIHITQPNLEFMQERLNNIKNN